MAGGLGGLHLETTKASDASTGIDGHDGGREDRGAAQYTDNMYLLRRAAGWVWCAYTLERMSRSSVLPKAWVLCHGRRSHTHRSTPYCWSLVLVTVMGTGTLPV